MLYWIYDVPALWIVALVAVLFVGVCWLGIFLFRPFVRRRLSPDAGMNEILGDFLQYFRGDLRFAARTVGCSHLPKSHRCGEGGQTSPTESHSELDAMRDRVELMVADLRLDLGR